MEINGADLDPRNKKNPFDDDMLRKYWRIKDQMKRKILLDYIKKNSPNASLQVYTLVPLTSLTHEQCKELLKSDDGVKKIMNFDAFSEGGLTGEDLGDLKDSILLRYW